MTPNELNFLFNKYLDRNFKTNEWSLHNQKKYNDFEVEIANCDERIKKIYGVKRMAILLTGHIRKNSILDGLKNFCALYQYDVFVHTWDNLGLKGNETNLNDNVNEDTIKKELNKIPNLVKYEIENNKEFIEGLPKKNGYFNHSSPEPFIKSQLYSITKCYDILENYIKETNTEYSVVLRFRFDSEMTDFNLTSHIVKDINEHNIIFTPNKDSDHQHSDYGTSCWMCDNMYYKYKLKNVHIFEHTNVICDLFAYGSVKSMKDYCSLYKNYDKLNDSYHEKNMESIKIHNKNMHISDDGDYIFKGDMGHLDTLYYYYCSYPERMLQMFLKNYMLVESKTVKLKLVR